jgi:hypothetical protein
VLLRRLLLCPVRYLSELALVGGKALGRQLLEHVVEGQHGAPDL